MSTEQAFPPVVLPCGCVITGAVVDGVRTLTYAPCRQSCPNLANALDLANERGLSPEYRER